MRRIWVDMERAKLERDGCRVQVEPDELERRIERDSLAERLAAQMRDAERMQQLHQLAAKYARSSPDSPIAHEIVTDVIEDMLTGDASSDPARDILPQIVAHVIGRAKRRRKPNALPLPDDERPRKRRHLSPPVWVPLERAPPDALVSDTSALRPGEGSHPDIDPVELVGRIRHLAKDDEPALQLLALHERALKGRKRLMRRHVLQAGMTDWTYRAARERLLAYAATAASATAGATSATATTSNSGGAPDATMLPITRAIGLEGRTARVRRSVSRALGHTLRAPDADT